MSEINIPVQLQDKKFKFIKLVKKNQPLEKWSEAKNQYCYDDNDLLSHLSKGGMYGVVTGNGLTVVDVDVEDQLLDFAFLSLGETFRVKTHRGYHLYFLTDHSKKQIVKSFDGEKLVDIQSNGQYVVGPNCPHDEGGVYEPSEVSIAKSTKDNIDFALEYYSSFELDRISDKLPSVSEGERNDTAFENAVAMRNKGLSPEKTFQVLDNWNSRNTPALDVEEIESVITSAFFSSKAIQSKSEVQKGNKHFDFTSKELSEELKSKTYSVHPKVGEEHFLTVDLSTGMDRRSTDMGLYYFLFPSEISGSLSGLKDVRGNEIYQMPKGMATTIKDTLQPYGNKGIVKLRILRKTDRETDVKVLQYADDAIEEGF